MPREIYYAVAGLVATERVSMGKIINMLLREALENRGLITNKKLTDRSNVDKILENQMVDVFRQWDSLSEKAKTWWLKKAEENKHLPIALEILAKSCAKGDSTDAQGSGDNTKSENS
jgi:hypothetical protein